MTDIFQDNSGSKQYDIAAIRKLILAAFTPLDLKIFCQDRDSFKLVVTYFGQNDSLQEMAEALIDYCETRSLFPDLLKEIQQQRPRPFKKYFPYICKDEVPAEGKARSLSFEGLGEKAKALLEARRVVWLVALFLVVLVAVGFLAWPKIGPIIFPATPTPTPKPPPVHLVDARVWFVVTTSSGQVQEFPVGSALSLAPGAGLLLEMQVTMNGEPFPHRLTFQYFAPRGSIPGGYIGSRASYVAPDEPGPDVISVSIRDQETGEEIIRSINVVVDEPGP